MSNESNHETLARRICDVLDQGTATLDEETAARLRDIRQAALKRQVLHAPALSLAGIGHGLEQIGHFLADPIHNHYRGILAAIALLVGAFGANLWQNARQATELAEIDSALLSDEVPPGAYSDQGFLEWLERFTSEDSEEEHVESSQE